MFTDVVLDGLTLAQLRYFAAVAEGETFADAAATVGISQSALSQGIARLESVTGARLLERDGRRRRLTEAGDLVAEYARRVLGESETLAEDLTARRTGQSGRVRIGLIDAAALYLLNKQIRRFRSDHRGIDLAITVAGSDDLEQALLDFRVDVAVVVGPARRATTTLLMTESMHVYGSGTELAERTWALYPTGSRTRDAIDAGLTAAGIEPNVVAESGNPAVLRELASLTGSLTVLPTGVAGGEGDLDTVRRDIAHRNVLLATRPDRSVSAVVATFTDAMAG